MEWLAKQSHRRVERLGEIASSCLLAMTARASRNDAAFLLAMTVRASRNDGESLCAIITKNKKPDQGPGFSIVNSNFTVRAY